MKTAAGDNICLPCPAEDNSIVKAKAFKAAFHDIEILDDTLEKEFSAGELSIIYIISNVSTRSSCSSDMTSRSWTTRWQTSTLQVSFLGETWLHSGMCALAISETQLHSG